VDNDDADEASVDDEDAESQDGGSGAKGAGEKRPLDPAKNGPSGRQCMPKENHK